MIYRLLTCLYPHLSVNRSRPACRLSTAPCEDTGTSTSSPQSKPTFSTWANGMASNTTASRRTTTTAPCTAAPDTRMGLGTPAKPTTTIARDGAESAQPLRPQRAEIAEYMCLTVDDDGQTNEAMLRHPEETLPQRPAPTAQSPRQSIAAPPPSRLEEMMQQFFLQRVISNAGTERPNTLDRRQATHVKSFPSPPSSRLGRVIALTTSTTPSRSDGAPPPPLLSVDYGRFNGVKRTAAAKDSGTDALAPTRANV